MYKCEVDIGRCICVHGQFQASDAILQCILYQRAIVPAPVNQILTYSETTQELKFVENYGKIREALKEVFRSVNRDSLKQILILIGNSCLLPRELYLVNIDLCETEDPENCHPDCSQLTDKEFRKVSSTLLFSMFNNTFKLSNTAASQVYLFVRAKSTLHFPGDLVEEDEGFELPSESAIERKKIHLHRILLKHHCNKFDVSQSPEDDSNLTWFRILPHLRRFTA